MYKRPCFKTRDLNFRENFCEFAKIAKVSALNQVLPIFPQQFSFILTQIIGEVMRTFRTKKSYAKNITFSFIKIFFSKEAQSQMFDRVLNTPLIHVTSKAYEMKSTRIGFE